MVKIFLLISSFLHPGLIQVSGINSLQPVTTYETIVADQRITGTWTAGEEEVVIERLPNSKILKEDGSNERKLPLGENDKEVSFYSKTYAVTIKQHNIAYIMLGMLTRINGQLYMDILPLGAKDGANDSGFEFSNYYLPVFNIARIDFTKDGKLSINYLNGSFIKEQVINGRIRLKHEKDRGFDTFLLTASSFELRQFLEKYGPDERLYSEAGTTVLTRK
ncbi:hypothetical protein [Paraflavitalea speifideaquila]|uniref:hypothetical protein n=1 Tax=Paraflavitalea speifideaquila TaxID=3076558 RepID=UPI0028ED61F0|nr:hypothetical protein [Paraflavitalea speifideiaquila]